jgi:NAD(P)-dependent dehydrogenase (short-subunit alcohol dehydrogenase family)
MGDFDGKVILVTGGATGLGAAIAIGAAKRGAKALILNYSKASRRREATASVAGHRRQVAIVQGDVARTRLPRSPTRRASASSIAGQQRRHHLTCRCQARAPQARFSAPHEVNTVGRSR